jgi:hypothetical protein
LKEFSATAALAAKAHAQIKLRRFLMTTLRRAQQRELRPSLAGPGFAFKLAPGVSFATAKGLLDEPEKLESRHS